MKAANLLICVAAVLALSTTVKAAKPFQTPKVLIPAYFFIGTSEEDYGKLLTSASILGDRLVLVVNPNNGPVVDKKYTDDYRRFIMNIRAMGSKVLGYVHTSYGTRDASKVNRDVDHWYDHFAIDGVFLDETSCAEAHYWHYYNMVHYIKLKASMSNVVVPTIALNPGYVSEEQDPRFAGLADIIVAYEAGMDQLNNFAPPQWVVDSTTTSLSMMVHTASNFESATQVAQENNLEYVYATDLEVVDLLTSNPWGSLPSYWLQFSEAMSAQGTTAGSQNLMLPVYFDYEGNEAEFERVRTAARAVGSRMSVILRVKGGALRADNPSYDSYREFCSDVTSLGAKLYGYVDTIKGFRDIADINRDVDAWYDHLDRVDGIFYDNVELWESMYWPHYNDQTYAKLKASTNGQPEPNIILGASEARRWDDSRYFNFATMLVVVHSTQAVAHGYIAPEWVAAQDDSRLAIMANECNDWSSIFAKARASGIAHVMVTNRAGGDAEFSELPSYFEDVVDAIKLSIRTPEQQIMNKNGLRGPQPIIV